MTDESDYRISPGGGVPWHDLSVEERNRPPERDVEITGIETALWDIKGKALGVPVYELLGGKYRDRVEVYCDTHGSESLGKATERGIHAGIVCPRGTRGRRGGFGVLKFDLDRPTPT